MLVDSHCHLDRIDLSLFGDNLQNVIANANNADIGAFLCPSIDLEHFPDVMAIAEKYTKVSATVGVHPSEQVPQPNVEDLITLGDNPKVVGIGETGLDYYYCKDDHDRERQCRLFRTHIKAALKLKKPLVVHSRDASKDILDILRTENASEVGGVMHCFTEDWQMAEAAIALNFYISFSGIITFKSADMLREVAKLVPIEKLLIETDSPYLAPVPMRGKPNQPAYLRYIAEYLAMLRGISYEELATQTTENFCRLFKRP